jgi:hypothetical protein
MAPAGPPKWMKTRPLRAESANGESGSPGMFFDRVSMSLRPTNTHENHPTVSSPRTERAGSGLFLRESRWPHRGHLKVMKTHPLLVESAIGESGSLGMFFDRVSMSLRPTKMDENQPTAWNRERRERVSGLFFEGAGHRGLRDEPRLEGAVARALLDKAGHRAGFRLHGLSVQTLIREGVLRPCLMRPCLIKPSRRR